MILQFWYWLILSPRWDEAIDRGDSTACDRCDRLAERMFLPMLIEVSVECVALTEFLIHLSRS